MGAKKSTYVAPRLERYGSLSELTAGGSGVQQEGQGFVGVVTGMGGLGFGFGLGGGGMNPTDRYI